VVSFFVTLRPNKDTCYRLIVLMSRCVLLQVAFKTCVASSICPKCPCRSPHSTVTCCTCARAVANGGPVVPDPPFEIGAPHFTFGLPVAADIQYCIWKIWPPLLFLAPLLLNPGDGPDHSILWASAFRTEPGVYDVREKVRQTCHFIPPCMHFSWIKRIRHVVDRQALALWSRRS